MANKTYLVIGKSNKSESSERLGDEDIRDLAILHEELAQIIRSNVLSATANKHLPAPHWLVRTLLFGTTQNKLLALQHSQTSSDTRIWLYASINISKSYMFLLTFELGSLQSHHLPSIMCRWVITLPCVSQSANRTKPKPFEFPVFASRFTWKEKQTALQCYVQTWTNGLWKERHLLVTWVTSATNLHHNHITKGTEIFFQVLFWCFPRQTQHNQIWGLLVSTLDLCRRSLNFIHFALVIGWFYKPGTTK